MKPELQKLITDVRGKIKVHSSLKYNTRKLTDITSIAIHHSATLSGSAASFANHHVNINGWPGIGYAYVINKDGKIERCNSLDTVSYHAGDNNKGALGICIIGDFTQEKPTVKQLNSAYLLIEYLMEEVKTIKSIKGHNEYPGYASTACPALNMTEFRNNYNAWLNPVIPELTPIMGKAIATIEQMTAYIKSKNPSVPASVINMIPLYISEGEIEGVRGDIVFAQSCLETGNFTFANSSVTLDQNNFCGMGVTASGMKGNSFITPLMGIRAQIHHLKAYGSKLSLVNECQSPRFNLVTRGCAEYVEWLGQKENPNGYGWATGEGYGNKILNIWVNILQMPTAVADTPAPVTDSLNNTANTPSGWATEAWDWGIANGITDGSNPKNPATREQVIQLFYVFNKYLNSK